MCIIYSVDCTYNFHSKARPLDPGPYDSHHTILPKPQPPRPKGYVYPLLCSSGTQIRLVMCSIWKHVLQIWSDSSARYMSFFLRHPYHCPHPQQYPSRSDAADALSLTHGHALTDSCVLRERHNLGPLPTSAYSKPEDMDPLSLLAEETTDSDDEFFSETNLGPIPQEPNGEPTSCFYGKSSLFAFTNKAFDERGEAPPTSTNHAHAYRKEFWTFPDVILST